MDVPSFEHRANILEWDSADVHAWLTTLGLPQYEAQIKEHKIAGDVLVLLDAEGLKDVGIATIGQRLTILKAVYSLKLAQNIPIDPDHYVPPSEVEERREHLSVERLYDVLRDQGERLRVLEEENRRLSENLHICLEDIHSVRASQSRPNDTESPIQRQHSFKWANFVKPSRSPTKSAPEVVESPQVSPQRAEHDINASASRNGTTSRPQAAVSTSTNTAVSHASTSTSATLTSGPPRPTRQESSDNLKSFKVSLDDPAWKVLPAALKKYKINNDDWQNYAMFICYGTTGNRIERCLSYDEKPLLLFQRLKDGKKNPVFMLKHIKDIRSPIAVAQQKQAARKASSESSRTPPGPTQAPGPDSAHRRPPHLQVNHLTGLAPGLLTAGLAGQGGAGWPEVMSPAVESKDRADDFADGSKLPNAGNAAPGAISTEGVAEGSSTGSGAGAAAMTIREIPPSTGLSYAVAIYPYMAEQEDEFDVVVGDTFIILSRARGWWVVQRDPAGSGTVEPDMKKQGWVPAGCLLETSVPVATAIAEATARSGGSASASPPTSPTGKKTPILPLSILSTSFPGIALMDYAKKGEEELDLVKDDSLRVFKRYNHWSYAVKEENGERGWVPSWFIGKVPAAAGVPPTPSTSGGPTTFAATSMALDGDTRFTNEISIATQQPQVSPMSSAFPPMQSRTTAVV